MTFVRSHIAHIAIIALIAALAFVALRGIDQGQPVGSFAQPTHTQSQHSKSKYPDCSFDGDFSNDKPGACPAAH